MGPENPGRPDRVERSVPLRERKTKKERARDNPDPLQVKEGVCKMKEKKKRPRALTIVAVVLVLAVVSCVYNLVTTGSIGGKGPGGAGSSPAGGTAAVSTPAVGTEQPAPGSGSASDPGLPEGSSSGEASEAPPASGPLPAGYYTIPSGAKFYFQPSVSEDVTGLWRIAATSDNFVAEENAVEYYRAFFASDDEVHAVWNATLGTMTRITCSGGILSASTLEYVDGEEHSAKTLFSGAVLSTTNYNAVTGDPIA